jgi:hypothetical protein
MLIIQSNYKDPRAAVGILIFACTIGIPWLFFVWHQFNTGEAMAKFRPIKKAESPISFYLSLTYQVCFSLWLLLYSLIKLLKATSVIN